MKAFMVTVRTATRRDTFPAIAETSFAAYMNAANDCGDELFSIFVVAA